MGLFDFFGKERLPASIFLLKTEIHPYTVSAHRNEYVDLEVFLQNTYDREMLSSIVITTPKGLGFDRSCISQEREIRLGMLKPGDSKNLKVQLWATQRTEKGAYTIHIHAISHYQDYAHVLNEVAKTVEFRVS